MGYVKLNRNLLRWEWFGNDNALLVLVRLTLKAAWRDTQYQGVALKRGQVITTLQEIVDESQLTKQQVRTALERLEATHKITRTPTKKFSIITLLDYDCFFENNTQNSTQITHEQHTGQHTDNTPSLLKEKSKKKEEVRREEGARAREPAPPQTIDRAYLVREYGEKAMILYEQKFRSWGKIPEISYPMLLGWMVKDEIPAITEAPNSSIDPADVMEELRKQYSEEGQNAD